MSYSEKIALLDTASEKIKNLSIKLGLPIVEALSTEYEMYLEYRNDVLCLSVPAGQMNKELLRLSIDFLSTQLSFRQQRISRKSEPLLRAIGGIYTERLQVIDATAGLGRDAFLLASYNCCVTLIEQSTVVAALLEDGLARAESSIELAEVIGRMTLVNANAVQYLSAIEQKPDVIYLDPMFPPRLKTAKVKKEMQVLHALLGYSDELHDAALLKLCLQQAKQRVVVKRPKKASHLAGLKPSYSLNTKAMRFDIYLIS